MFGMKRLWALFILLSFLYIQVHGVFHDSMEHGESEECEICLILSTPLEPSYPLIKVIEIERGFEKEKSFPTTGVLIKDIFLEDLENRGPPVA